MKGTVTALDKDGNVLLIGQFFDLNSRKALEIAIRTLYGIHVYATTIAPTDSQTDYMAEPVGQGENDYWLPTIHDDDSDSGDAHSKIVYFNNGVS